MIHYLDLLSIAKDNKNFIYFNNIKNNEKILEHPLNIELGGYLKFNSNDFLFYELIDYEKNKKPSEKLINHINKMIDDICSDPKYLDYAKDIKKITIYKTTGFLYLLKISGKYKIGITVNPKNRFSVYSADNPDIMEIIFCEKVREYKKLETEIKKIFKDKNHKGEWFNFNDNDVKKIKEIILLNKI